MDKQRESFDTLLLCEPIFFLHLTSRSCLGNLGTLSYNLLDFHRNLCTSSGGLLCCDKGPRRAVLVSRLVYHTVSLVRGQNLPPNDS